MTRHHHGDGDEPIPVQEPGQPFDVFMSMMQADIALMSRMVDSLYQRQENDMSDTPLHDDAEFNSARRFLNALTIITNTRVATRKDIRNANRH